MEYPTGIFPKTGLALDYQHLYRLVYDQIEKDFHPHVTMTLRPETLSSDWLFSEVKRLLNYIIEKQNSALGSIIYRVDLSEKMVKTTMHTTIREDKLDELAAMILRREAQKVWIRQNYSSE